MSRYPSRSTLPVKWVSEKIIRRAFKDNQILESVNLGRLKRMQGRSNHPEPPPTGEPICTKSQMIYYYDSNGDKVAAAHQYLRPDGTLGAGGLPDPKMLIVANQILKVRSKPKRETRLRRLINFLVRKGH